MMMCVTSQFKSFWSCSVQAVAEQEEQYNKNCTKSLVVYAKKSIQHNNRINVLKILKVAKDQKSVIVADVTVRLLQKQS